MNIYVGIDVGKTHYRVGVVRGNSELLDFVKVPYPRSTCEALVASLTTSVEERIRATGNGTEAIAGIGLALPGIVDRRTGILIHGPDWDFMAGRSISTELASRFQCPVVAESDPLAATWGELVAGVGLGCDRFAVLTWGTSVGAGLVLDRRVVSYPQNLFPEFGHCRVSDDDRLCMCGARGCFATMVSGNGIAQSGQEAVESGASDALAVVAANSKRRITAADVFEAAEQGDEGARAILDRVGELFGRLYANLVYFCQPEKIVVTGGLTGRFPTIRGVVMESMKANCWFLAGGYTSCEPVMSALGDTAGVLGAARQVGVHVEAKQ